MIGQKSKTGKSFICYLFQGKIWNVFLGKRRILRNEHFRNKEDFKNEFTEPFQHIGKKLNVRTQRSSPNTLSDVPIRCLHKKLYAEQYQNWPKQWIFDRYAHKTQMIADLIVYYFIRVSKEENRIWHMAWKVSVVREINFSETWSMSIIRK